MKISLGPCNTANRLIGACKTHSMGNLHTIHAGHTLRINPSEVKTRRDSLKAR
jgi:hypothetical protein